MIAKSIEVQLKRMARELIEIAKVLNCSVHLNVTKYHNGTYGGSVFKIDKSAADFDFHDGEKINFAGLVADKRHLVPLERQREL